MFTPRAEYLPDFDILMVYVREGTIARTRSGGNLWTNVDVDAAGDVIDVEFVNATGVGVDLRHVPERETVARLIRAAGLSFPEPAPPVAGERQYAVTQVVVCAVAS